MTEPIAFRLNGRPVTIRQTDDAPLLFVLRNELGLTATRFGCGQEQCGACMVAVDGRPTCACTASLNSVSGSEVVTAEGLAADPVGAALLEAFDGEQAGQCGYCLPGILVSAFAQCTRRWRPFGISTSSDTTPSWANASGIRQNPQGLSCAAIC